MQAVFHGHYMVVEYLLAAGADPEIGRPVTSTIAQN